MDAHGQQHGIRQTIQDLLFNPDPTRRRIAAESLGTRQLRASDEGDALEALNTAMHDPHTGVQETVLQSLVRLSR